MRKAGTIPDSRQARRFGDYLLSLGVENRVDDFPDGAVIWIIEDAELEGVKQELAVFLANPTDTKYDKSRDAAAIRKHKEREQRVAKERFVDVRRTWRTTGGGGSTPITMSVIVVCVALHIIFTFGPSSPASNWVQGLLLFASGPGRLLTDLFSGEVWRLVTPIFLHSGLLHLGFNMLWLLNLGRQIEHRRGKRGMLALFLGIAVFSNLCQYLWHGPLFVGMSGVVYGLFGYIWVQSKYRVPPDLWIDKNSSWLLMGWLVLCMTGILGAVANGAHVGGLVAGVVLGAGPFLRSKLR